MAKKPNPETLVSVKIPHAARRLAKVRAAQMGIPLAAYIGLVLATDGVEALVRREREKRAKATKGSFFTGGDPGKR
jgi:hypothetical protein